MDPTPQQRAAFRAFVRAHHPDRGGDPATFVAGVERLRAEAEAGTEPDSEPGDGTPTGPAAPLPFPVRVGVALIRTWRRRHEHRADDPRGGV
jgi:hypothetical protein